MAKPKSQRLFTDEWVAEPKPYPKTGKQTRWKDSRAEDLRLRVSRSMDGKTITRTYFVETYNADGKPAYQSMTAVDRFECVDDARAEAVAVAKRIRGQKEEDKPTRGQRTETFADGFQAWMDKREARVKPDTLAFYGGVWRRNLQPLGKRAMGSVTERDISRVFNKAPKREANLVRMISIGIFRRVGQPLNLDELPDPYPMPPRRMRIDLVHDLPIIWREAEDIPEIRLLMLGGWRRSEALSLQWEHVNLKRRSVLLVATKTDIDLDSPLADAQVGILKALKEDTGNHKYVFPGRTGYHHIGFTHITRFWKRLEHEDLLGHKVSNHDLRRAYTIVAEHDLMLHERVTRQLTNHAPAGDAHAAYQEPLPLNKLRPHHEAIVGKLLEYAKA